MKSNSHLQFSFHPVQQATKTSERHDRANDNGNFNWMNTLLTIIKGSAFSQYDFHNASLRRRHMVPIVCRTKIFTICSRCVPSLMPFDPNNSQFRVKNEHSMHEKSICHRKLHGYGFFSSMQQPRKNWWTSLRQCWIILCCRSPPGEWEKVSGGRWDGESGDNISESGTTRVSTMLLICAFFRRRFVRVDS